MCVQLRRISGSGKSDEKLVKYEIQTPPTQYNVGADSTIGQKRKREESVEVKGQLVG